MWRSAVQVCLGLQGPIDQGPGQRVLPIPRESGGLAQLARAPALQAGGQRFESVILHRQGPEGPAEIFDMLYKQDCS